MDFFDLNLVRGLLLILLIVGFLGIWAWAWSRHRKRDFEQMSMLPLEEDRDEAPQGDNTTERTKE
ncbi:MAG: CcoQ/FixQ family Cbb3-type cytochrome c oxidase assembly chaperone [Gammaproteobacteria bacterium]|nr:CcoQ/FixQ family Cbb3-type cytochrome c oxidase assembly chaperone [Gammaproteobacteria bacterium]NNJ79311.1 CcoQ/FixQ family Cbb3-type cytochrome c oxidase assembly chaperone [Xanthomonadales bacterium]